MITSTLPPGLERVEETTVKYIRHDPITFEQFLGLFGPKDFVELVNGCVVEKPMVQWDHEDLLGWLTAVARWHVATRKLGAVAGSRTAVRISSLGTRLPDFLFVSTQRLSIIQQKAIMEAPDLVIEIRSPSNTASETVALESDYLAVGVQEVIFIDPQRKRVRIKRRRGDEYESHELSEGVLTIETIPGLWFELDWLFGASRPELPDAVARIAQGPAGR